MNNKDREREQASADRGSDRPVTYGHRFESHDTESSLDSDSESDSDQRTESMLSFSDETSLDSSPSASTTSSASDTVVEDESLTDDDDRWSVVTVRPSGGQSSFIDIPCCFIIVRCGCSASSQPQQPVCHHPVASEECGNRARDLDIEDTFSVVTKESFFPDDVTYGIHPIHNKSGRSKAPRNPDSRSSRIQYYDDLGIEGEDCNWNGQTESFPARTSAESFWSSAIDGGLEPDRHTGSGCWRDEYYQDTSRGYTEPAELLGPYPPDRITHGSSCRSVATQVDPVDPVDQVDGIRCCSPLPRSQLEPGDEKIERTGSSCCFRSKNRSSTSDLKICCVEPSRRSPGNRTPSGGFSDGSEDTKSGTRSPVDQRRLDPNSQDPISLRKSRKRSSNIRTSKVRLSDTKQSLSYHSADEPLMVQYEINKAQLVASPQVLASRENFVNEDECAECEVVSRSVDLFDVGPVSPCSVESVVLSDRWSVPRVFPCRASVSFEDDYGVRKNRAVSTICRPFKRHETRNCSNTFSFGSVYSLSSVPYNRAQFGACRPQLQYACCDDLKVIDDVCRPRSRVTDACGRNKGTTRYQPYSCNSARYCEEREDLCRNSSLDDDLDDDCDYKKPVAPSADELSQTSEATIPRRMTKRRSTYKLEPLTTSLTSVTGKSSDEESIPRSPRRPLRRKKSKENRIIDEWTADQGDITEDIQPNREEIVSIEEEEAEEEEVIEAEKIVDGIHSEEEKEKEEELKEDDEKKEEEEVIEVVEEKEKEEEGICDPSVLLADLENVDSPLCPCPSDAVGTSVTQVLSRWKRQNCLDDDLYFTERDGNSTWIRSVNSRSVNFKDCDTPDDLCEALETNKTYYFSNHECCSTELDCETNGGSYNYPTRDTSSDQDFTLPSFDDLDSASIFPTISSVCFKARVRSNRRRRGTHRSSTRRINSMMHLLSKTLSDGFNEGDHNDSSTMRGHYEGVGPTIDEEIEKLFVEELMSAVRSTTKRFAKAVLAGRGLNP